MKTIQAANQQSILDLAMQHCGAAEAAMPIAALNGLPLDAALTPGQPLLIPEPTDGRVVAQLARQGVAPATAWVPEPEPEDPNALRVVGYEVVSFPDGTIIASLDVDLSGNFMLTVTGGWAHLAGLQMNFNRPFEAGDHFRLDFGVNAVSDDFRGASSVVWSVPHQVTLDTQDIYEHHNREIFSYPGAGFLKVRWLHPAATSLGFLIYYPNHSWFSGFFKFTNL